jgi:hypothetical protein
MPTIVATPHQAVAHQPRPVDVARVEIGDGVDRLLLVGPRDPLARTGFACSVEPAHS